MAQRKRRTKKEIEAASVDTNNVRAEDATKDDAAEERGNHLQDIAAKDKAHKANNKVVDYHYELNGNKLLKKVRKASGALHSFYVGNITKDATLLQNEDVKAHLKK